MNGKPPNHLLFQSNRRGLQDRRHHEGPVHVQAGATIFCAGLHLEIPDFCLDNGTYFKYMDKVRMQTDSHEVHANTMEDFRSLPCNWLRPHHGISQEKLPLHLGIFEFTHSLRKRGKVLLHSLVKPLVK